MQRGLFLCLMFVILSRSVFCDVCFTYDFQDGFNLLFDRQKGQCQNQRYTWKLDSFSSQGIVPLNRTSTRLIYPESSSDLSCICSFYFKMGSGGFVELLVFTENARDTDHIFMMVNNIRDEILGTVTYTPAMPDFVPGWQRLRVDITDLEGSIDGYLEILGSKSEDSIVLIDSFRYVPSNINEKDCRVYKEVDKPSTVTELPTTVSEEDITSETEEEDMNLSDDKCTTYNFEENFDQSFDADKGPCLGLPNKWNLGRYSTSGIEPPNKRSTKFMSPEISPQVSCVSSFNFNISNGGIIELLVFTKNAQATDQIVILVQTVRHETISVNFYNPQTPDFIQGWMPIRIELAPSSFVESYLVFMGVASESSVILIDSFRYVPPTIKEENCKIYKESELLTTLPPTPTTTAQWVTEDDESQIISTVTEAPTTTTTSDEINSTVTELSATEITTTDNYETTSTATKLPITVTDDNSNEIHSTATELPTTTINHDENESGSTVTAPPVTTMTADDINKVNSTLTELSTTTISWDTTTDGNSDETYSTSTDLPTTTTSGDDKDKTDSTVTVQPITTVTAEDSNKINSTLTELPTTAIIWDTTTDDNSNESYSTSTKLPITTTSGDDKDKTDSTVTVQPITTVTAEDSNKINSTSTELPTTTVSGDMNELNATVTESPISVETDVDSNEDGEDSSSSESHESNEEDTNPSVTTKPKVPGANVSFWVKMKLKLKMHFNMDRN